MSQSVVIPKIGADPFIVNINNVVYSYKAGSTVTVPDEVASLIANINANLPSEETAPSDGQVYTYTVKDKGVWKDLPKASAEEIGGVLMGDAVADATDADDVVAQLNALIASLVDAGVIAEYVEPEAE